MSQKIEILNSFFNPTENLDEKDLELLRKYFGIRDSMTKYEVTEIRNNVVGYYMQLLSVLRDRGENSEMTDYALERIENKSELIVQGLDKIFSTIEIR